MSATKQRTFGIRISTVIKLITKEERACSLQEINDTYNNDSQTDKNNLYDSIIIAKLCEVRHWNCYVMESREKLVSFYDVN